MTQKQTPGTPNPDLLDPLKRTFGYFTFRENQETIIRAILAKRDVFSVMPTGGGKSLCYQLPAQLMPGTTVVISPLISLMKDQVDAAVTTGIQAAQINSSLAPGEMSAAYERLLAGTLDLLYVSPERFAMDQFIAILKKAPLAHVAIDEAHCISEWGHDFRPDYLSLSRVVTEFPGVPVSAFTATATMKVQEDIITKLNLRDPLVVRASFNRPNLFYRVVPKERVDDQILAYIKERKGESGIIYRTTRQSVEKTAANLVKRGIRALPYHAGMESAERTASQEAFNRDTVQVIVATVAFGMGIDKSNVRFIIHADLPKNIESFYQETGRAGRDGEPAECVLFFSTGDIPKIRFFIDRMSDEEEQQRSIRKLNDMVNYASVNACRRRQLLAYFDEVYGEHNCGTCDVCSGEVERVLATEDAQIAMSAVMRTGQRFGAVYITDVIVGADTQKIRDFNHDRIKTYGAGKHQDRRYWRRIIDELVAQGCLESSGHPYPGLHVTRRGMEILTGGEPFYVLKEREKEKEKKKTPRAAGEPVAYNDDLFGELRVLRKEIADLHDVPPYIIFSDRTLHEFCSAFPLTREDMLLVNGVGEKKFEKYGASFIKAIASFLERNPGLVQRVPVEP